MTRNTRWSVGMDSRSGWSGKRAAPPPGKPGQPFITEGAWIKLK